MQAQFDEIGTFIGISTYSGDLTERRLEPLEFNPAMGVYVRRTLSKKVSLKVNLYRGVISGDDARSSVESGLWRRNLSFRSELYELGVLFEYAFLSPDDDFFYSTPYVFGGISAFYFNPQTALDGKIYDLRVYRTEGVAYSPFQAAIPFGAGFKMVVNQRGSLGLEVGLRKTFTDYLDDVSGTYAADLIMADRRNAVRTRLAYRAPEILPDAPPLPPPGQQRGNPEKDDWYFFFGLTLGLRLSQ
ncbi:MAG: hypothetical protein D6714_04165 [Bacteroidetes bacterium]|nr:MAG: hypothetical protein D6714_04165 [Bacteroidota bacterium]